MNEITEQILPKKILNLLHNLWAGRIMSLIVQDDELEIIIELKEDVRHYTSLKLKIRTIGLKANFVSLDWINIIEVYDDHYLLEEQTDVTTELFIKRVPVNSTKFKTEMLLLQCSRYHKHILNHKYLNPDLISEGLDKLKIGQFAIGPKCILEDYYKILDKYECEPYYFNEDLPNNKIIEHQLKLLVLGNSYFIATEFDFR